MNYIQSIEQYNDDLRAQVYHLRQRCQRMEDLLNLLRRMINQHPDVIDLTNDQEVIDLTTTDDESDEEYPLDLSFLED